jgi:hypothetical protein
MGRKKSTLTLLERLLYKTNVGQSHECWEWQGAKNNTGFGFIRDESKMRTVHRVSYEEHYKRLVPANKCVLHSCNNYLCVNPNHLRIGDRKDLTAQLIDNGRQKFWGGTDRKPRLGQKQPTTNCPHCGRDIANHLFGRWHGDNCKQKP